MNINYKAEYYKNNRTKKEPVKEFILNLSKRIRAKIFTYIKLLEKEGKLKYPYTRHIKTKIWELRIDFGRNYHRIFYFIFTSKRIILLHAFSKKTKKTPLREIEKAINNYKDFINNKSNN